MKLIEKINNAELSDIGMMLLSGGMVLTGIAFFIFIIWLIFGGYAMLAPS